MDMYTLLYLKWITYKDLQHKELCPVLCNNLKWEKNLKKDTCIHIIESLCFTLETNITLINYTPI